MRRLMSPILLILGIALPSSGMAASIEINVGFDGGGSLFIQREVKSIQEIQRRNVVMQERDYSCGSASLATLFNFYLEDPVHEEEIIKTLLAINREKGTIEKVIERKGFSLFDLKQFAESRNFKANGFRLNFEDLVSLGVPAIVPIMPRGYKHFVVFRGADRDRVYLADPSAGNITESIEQFKEDWFGFTNVALVILPPDGKKLTGFPMSITDLDQVFIGQSEIGPLVSQASPFMRLIPGEF